MDDSLLSQVQQASYLDKNFWKKVSLAASEGLILFLFSFAYMNYLEGGYKMTSGLIIFFAVFIFLFFFVFFLRALVEESSGFLVYSSIADAIILFLPIVLDVDTYSVKERISHFSGYWLYFVLVILFLISFFILAALKVRSTDNLYIKFSWHRIIKGSSFYLIIALSVFLTFCLMICLLSGYGDILTDIFNGIISSVESSLKIFLPKFSMDMNFNDLAKSMKKEYLGPVLSAAFSKTFHISVDAVTSLRRAFELFLSEKFKNLKTNKFFILSLGAISFSFFYSLLKIIEILVALTGRLLVEVLIASKFIKKTWIKISKETIAF